MIIVFWAPCQSFNNRSIPMPKQTLEVVMLMLHIEPDRMRHCICEVPRAAATSGTFKPHQPLSSDTSFMQQFTYIASLDEAHCSLLLPTLPLTCRVAAPRWQSSGLIQASKSTGDDPLCSFGGLIKVLHQVRHVCKHTQFSAHYRFFCRCIQN